MRNIIVLKCGGSTIDRLSDDFFENIVTLQKAGFHPVIVHGGGPAIKDMLTKQHIETTFVDGLRKTTQPVMDVVEMILTGVVNNAIVRRLNDANIQSVGLSGTDANLLTAEAKDFERYGYVGHVTEVNALLLQQLIDLGIVPVIAPIALGQEGTRYNINADLAAGAVAKALAAKQLIFVTDVPGIIVENQLLSTVNEQQVMTYIETGIIYGGMIPKVEAALTSLSEDLQEVMIMDGNQSVLATTESGLVGTIIKKEVGDNHVRPITDVQSI
ncbi:MAG TPA: acetylglutamate kinase [Virgibacillus sp.]|nr:acetylglutamate kinase [Virgibacillus sp.]